MDASWSTRATRLRSSPVVEPGPNTRCCNWWWALAAGVASQGSAASACPVFAAHLRAPAGGREHAVAEASQRAKTVGRAGLRSQRCIRQIEKKAHVELAAIDARQHLTAHALAKLGTHLWAGFHQLLGEGAQANKFRVVDGSGAQRAAHRGLQAGCGLAEIGQRGECLVGQRQQGGAVCGERHALRCAREQRQAGRFCQCLELQAHPRLAQMHVQFSSRDAALARDRRESAQGLGVESERDGAKIGFHICPAHKLIRPISSDTRRIFRDTVRSQGNFP